MSYGTPEPQTSSAVYRLFMNLDMGDGNAPMGSEILIGPADWFTTQTNLTPAQLDEHVQNLVDYLAAYPGLSQPLDAAKRYVTAEAISVSDG